MRWDALFTDLDARFDELADEALMAELADRTRVALGAVTVTARLAGAQGHRVRMTTVAGTSVAGVLEQVGPDWALLAEAPGREVLLNLRQVTLLDGLGIGTRYRCGGWRCGSICGTCCVGWRGTVRRWRWWCRGQGPRMPWIPVEPIPNSPGPWIGSARTSWNWPYTLPGNHGGPPVCAGWLRCR